MKTPHSLTAAFLVAALTLTTATPSFATDHLVLADGGTTHYTIVTAVDATPVDRYAAGELALYLGFMTGAEFAVINDSELGDGPAIFVGVGDAAKARLGEPNPTATLGEQEFVVRTHGSDLFLYGEGVHSSLHAVMDFLEDPLGWRWFSPFEHPLIPEYSTLSLAPLNRTGGFSYLYRDMHLHRSLDYPYQQGSNMRYDKRARQNPTHAALPRDQRTFISAIPETGNHTHSLFNYIPPSPHAHAFDWLERQNYFETNPEFFSLHNDRRVPNRQLCFSNPELRAELTRNILQHIELEGDEVIIDVGAMDRPGRFCEDPGCIALEEQYASPGGPIYDYLIELGTLLKDKYPKARIRTFGYRRAQTQVPPRLDPGQKLPANIIVEFAPIEDSYFADWSSPDSYIQETYQHMQQWSEILAPGNLWSWIYPAPWGTGSWMPVGNIERTINIMRQMHAAGVRGFYVDHGHTQNRRAGWGELQAYLIYKLAKDVDADTATIIREFTDYMYGPAAPLMRQYITELEEARKDIDVTAQGHVYATPGPGISYVSRQLDDRVFPYLTAQNIQRWQEMFNEMTALTAGQTERYQINVELARRELDLATLWQWQEMQAADPETYHDHSLIIERIIAADEARTFPAPEWEEKQINRRMRPMGTGVAKLLGDIIETAGPLAPLPAPLDSIDPSTIVQITAEAAFLSPRWSGRATLIRDPLAAGGLAIIGDVTQQPFSVGYLDELNQQRTQAFIDPRDVKTDGYALYHLGTTTASREAYFWLDRSWRTTFSTARNLFDPNHPNRQWDLWVSLRFAGPAYHDANKPNEKNHFFVDRFICIPIADDSTPLPADPTTPPSDNDTQPEFDFAQPNL